MYPIFFISQILVDTLMLTGTNPSLMIVREWILQGKISGEWAVQAMSALVPTIETPTKELLASFMVNLIFMLHSNYNELDNNVSNLCRNS